MRLVMISLGALLSLSLEAAEHSQLRSSVPSPRLSEPLKNLDSTPLSKLDHEDAERVNKELTEYLSNEIREDIESMKRKRQEDVDQRRVRALECLSENMSIYVRGADDSGLEHLRDIKSQKITASQFKAFFKTISNTIRFDHNFDE
jgi:hypothetical protein